MTILLGFIRFIAAVLLAPYIASHICGWIFYAIEPGDGFSKLAIIDGFITNGIVTDSDSPNPGSRAVLDLMSAEQAFAQHAMIAAYPFTFLIWLPITLILYGRFKRRLRHHFFVGLPLLTAGSYLMLFDGTATLTTLLVLFLFCVILAAVSTTVFYLIAVAGAPQAPATPKAPAEETST